MAHALHSDMFLSAALVQPLRRYPIRPFTSARTRDVSASAGKGSKKPSINNIPAPSTAPPVSSTPAPNLTDASSPQQPEFVTSPSLQPQTTPQAASLAGTNLGKVLLKKLQRELSSLPRAIAIMFAISGLSALGTIIPQNKPYDFYIDNYPAGPSKVLGFLSYDLLLGLQLDHVFSAWYFYGLVALLGASLAACTSTRQLPAVRVAQRWRFYSQPASLAKMGNAEMLPNAKLADLAQLLAARDYQVFVKEGSMYAFKGLSGRLGPIGVHAALLLILFGTALSGFAGYHGSAMAPEGSDFVVADFMAASSALSLRPSGADAVVHVNSFNIDYRPDGSVAQFYSDLSLLDSAGQEQLRKTISVNDPFRYGGVTMYQTDWSLAAVTLRVANPAAAGLSAAADEPFNLPLASLEGKPGVAGRLWATFLPVEAPQEGRAPRGVSLVARDMQSLIVYDSKGQFAGVRRPGSNKPIEVEGLQITVDNVIGSTGLEIKADPGVPWVYAGYAGLMVTTLVSYISHSQVWALQQGGSVYVAGKSNRAKVGFNKELSEVLDAVPEGSG